MAAASTGTLRVPSAPSTSSKSSLAPSQSLRSQRGQGQGTVRTIVTSPPWALDEPPSPSDDPDGEQTATRRPSTARLSDVYSYQSSAHHGSEHGSRWWAFTRPRTSEPSQHAPPKDSYEHGELKPPEKRGSMFRDRSKSWLATSNRRSQDATGLSPRPTKTLEGQHTPMDRHPNGWGLTIDLPPPPSAPFTMAQSRTPGWDSPWTARPLRNPEQDIFAREASDSDEKTGSRKKRLRTFILTNTYVPLLFRFLNILFTTSALAIAIRIRLYELHSHVMGAVGSSPTIVIIFAPLTLVHVMVAIYLEYFGRPLGLWNTSSKLTHTLMEVLFVCAWSAALSLCFDNFFTSLVPCAAPSSTSWYNQIPQPKSPLPDLGRHEGGVGDRICDDQVVLIILVGIGLIMYCVNLVISLFRIFEKVKYHPGARLTA